MRPSSGSWSILKSPVCSTVPAGVATKIASASGIEWLTATNSRSNGPTFARLALDDHHGDAVDPVLLQLRLEQREGEPRAEDRDVLALAQQVGHRADVVLVRVRQHDRLDGVEAVTDEVEVREDQVDAGLAVLGEQHAAVDDEQAAAVLEDRHVAADVAEPAERDDAQPVGRQRRRGAELGVRVASCDRTRSRRRRRRRARARGAPCPSRGIGSSGSRSAPPPGRAWCSSAAFTAMTPWVRVMIASVTGTSSSFELAREGDVAGLVREDRRQDAVGDEVAGDADRTHRADGQQRQVEGVVAGVVDELAARHHPLRGEQVALGVLVGHDLRVLGEAEQRRRWRSRRPSGPGCRRASRAGRWRRRPR